jgi:P4 family phage/plasmid primase-like protien
MESPPTEKKHSYHLVFRVFVKDCAVYFQDSTICKNFFEYMKFNKGIALLGVDKSLYNKNHLFRILNSSKLDYPDNKLTLITEIEDPLLTLATYINEKENDIILSKTTTILKKTKEKKPDVQPTTVDLNIQRELLMCLNGKRKYEDWNKLGILMFCISNGSNEGLELFKEFGKTKAPDGYNEELFNNSWENYKNLPERNYTIGTLYYLAKKENPIRYAEIMKAIYQTNYLTGTHRDVAQLFVDKFQSTVIRDTQNWYHFNDTSGIWVKDTPSLKYLNKKFDILCDEINASKQQTTDENNVKNIEIMTTNMQKDNVIRRLKDVSYKSNIIKELTHLLHIENNDFNNNKWVLPFQNGVYDLKEMKFRPGLYEEFITEDTGYNYTEVSSAAAQAFMKDIFPNNELYKYVLNRLSSYFVDEHRSEEFFVWTNKRGSNGKSTLISILSAVFGNFAYTCKPDFLMEQSFNNGEAASPSLVEMKGKRLIVYQEPKKSKRVKLEVGTIKSITGGDTLNGRRLYSDVQNFTTNAAHVLVCNDIPELNSTDGGSVRRIKIVQFETEFVETPTKPHQKPLQEIDKDSLKMSLLKLLLENFTEDKMQPPQIVQEYTDRYIASINNFGRFCNDYLIKDEDTFITRIMLKDYINSASIAREYEFNKNKLSANIDGILTHLDEKFVERKKVNGIDYRNVLLGYKIRDEQDVDVRDVE